MNLSDRYLAKISGTVLGQGNSPKRVADTLRHKWTVLEKEWPDTETVEEFYLEPPADLKMLAIARGAEYEFGYQYISNTPASVKTALKHSPVCIAVTAWLEQDGVYVRAPWPENHWTCIVKVLENGNYLCYDSFSPFLKEVNPEACKSVAMSYYLNKNVVRSTPFKRFIKLILSYVGL